MILFLAADRSHMAVKHDTLANEIRLTALITAPHSGVYAIDETIIKAMTHVPRHQYIQRPYDGFAYFNVALPVEGQDYMIPEPFLTAMMIHLMQIENDDTVLEIGYGSGYDAAVLSKLAQKVYSVSQHETLDNDKQGAVNHARRNILSRASNNIIGWPEAGPFDAILVRQSMTEPPLALLKQLKPGGRLVIPVGQDHDMQRLMVYTREPGGGIRERATLYVKMTPLLKGQQI